MSYIIHSARSFLQAAVGRTFVEGLIYEKQIPLTEEENTRYNSEFQSAHKQICRWQIWSNLVLSRRDDEGFVRVCKISVDNKQFLANQKGYEKEMALCRNNIAAAVSTCRKKLCEEPFVSVENGLLQTTGLACELADRNSEESEWWFINESGEFSEIHHGGLQAFIGGLLNNKATAPVH